MANPTGSDVVQLLKDAYAVYKAGKALKDDLDASRKKADQAAVQIQAAYAEFNRVVSKLPRKITRAECQEALDATRTLITARIESQQEDQDFEELGKLYLQLNTVNRIALAQSLAVQFDLSALMNDGRIRTILLDVTAAEGELQNQLAARGVARLGIKCGILAIDVGLVVLKAIA